jgi:hypothetical protein
MVAINTGIDGFKGRIKYGKGQKGCGKGRRINTHSSATITATSAALVIVSTREVLL